MRYNPKIHHRRSIRLKGYDYTQSGFYFVTLCVQHRAHLFGEIQAGKMQWSEAGKMINAQWEALIERYSEIVLHEFITMPNHFHALLEISPPVRATFMVAPEEGEENRKEEGGGDKEEKNRKEEGEENNRKKKKEDRDRNGGGQPQGIASTTDVPTTGQQGIAPTGDAPTGETETKKPRLGDIIGAFKSITTNEYIRNVKTNNWQRFDGKLWQRNYYEHIVRNERSHRNISNYIKNNPQKWSIDKFYDK